MHSYPRAAVERMMKVQEVILRAMAKKITWWQAAEILGMSDRQMRRLQWRYREHGYDGLLDRRVGKPSPKRVSLAGVEQGLGVYQEKYFDLNVRHFHEKLREQHQIRLSYTWVKKALQGAGLVRRERKRGVHRRRPAAARAEAAAGDSAAHRWEPAPLVSGRPLVRLAGDSGRCHQRDLLRATGRGRIDDDRAAGAAGSDRAARHFLRTVQRPRQSLLLDASGGRESGCGTSHASGTSVTGIEHSDDSCVFAAGPRAIGTRVWNLARAAAAGVAPAGNPHAGASEPVSAGALHGRVQSAVSGLGVAAGQSVFALPEKGSGCGVLDATTARGEPG